MERIRTSRSLSIVIVLLLIISACGGTEIDKNPAPIVWGGISFFPETIERSSGKTVWNNVKVAGYGHKGIIERVTILKNETIVENIQSDIYSAKKQIWKDVSGDYQDALEYFISGGYQEYKKGQIQSLPKFNVASYESEGERFTTPELTSSSSSTRVKNVSFSGFNDWEAKNIALNVDKKTEIRIASGSASKIFIPSDVEEHPENMVLANLELNNINIGEIQTKIEKIFVDYQFPRLKFAVNNVYMPGAVLAEFNIPNAPESLEGSLQGQGEIANNKVNADATLNLKNLLDISADLTGSLSAEYPEKINFTLKDSGILNYINDEQKGLLAMLALAVPNGQQALIGFLSRPGQTLSGNISFRGGTPVFKLYLK